MAVTCRFVTQTISNWEELPAYCRRQKGWIYRGQECAGWPLKTSLERACERFHGDLKLAADVERILMREFRRRFHHYSTYIPDPADDLEWLSIMQHHGAPTRLLDWTYSIYVAAYFALECASGDSAVWAVNAEWCKNQAISALNLAGKKTDWISKPVNEEDRVGFAETFVVPPPVKFAYYVNPFRLNQRLTIQSGVFMCPGDVSKTFEDNLCALNGYNNKDNVVKIVIPCNVRKSGLKDLHDMNVNRTTLFPDLDGFAQSLKIYHPALP